MMFVLIYRKQQQQKQQKQQQHNNNNNDDDNNNNNDNNVDFHQNHLAEAVVRNFIGILMSSFLSHLDFMSQYVHILLYGICTTNNYTNTAYAIQIIKINPAYAI